MIEAAAKTRRGRAGPAAWSRSAAVMGLIMEGRCEEEEIARFLAALHRKGETVAEIAGAATALRQHMTPIRTRRTDLLDTCGTGGDGSATFNISTAAALVAAAAGVAVAKHGNRAATSRSGSADVLAELGVNVEAGVACVEDVPGRTGRLLLFRAAAAPGHETRLPGAEEAGHAHDLQHPRPAGQSRRRAAAIARRGADRTAALAGRGPGPARLPAGPGRPRQRRPGRSHPERSDPGGRGVGRPAAGVFLDAGRFRPAAMPTWRRCGLPARPKAPRSSATSWRAGPDRPATSCVANAAAALWTAGKHESPQHCAGWRPMRSTAAPPRSCWPGWPRDHAA